MKNSEKKDIQSHSGNTVLCDKKIAPIYEVVAEFPENKDFPKGKKIEFVPWTSHPDYWMHVVEDCQGRKEWLAGYFDNFPAIFKRLR